MIPLSMITPRAQDDEDDDDVLFLFFMVERRKAFSLISSRNQCQRFSPSRISDTPQAGFEPAQNLSSSFVEWRCAVVIITRPRRSILILEELSYWYQYLPKTFTTWKLSVFGVFLVYVVYMRENKDQNTFHAVTAGSKN